MLHVYQKSDQMISASVGEPFVIELEGNPTTGYKWDLQLDSSKVKIIDRQYQASGGAMGSGGKERFTLQPVASGETSIRALYKRVWEPSAIEEHDFQLRVKT
jgi:inhibitor of cysteine peptidase